MRNMNHLDNLEKKNPQEWSEWKSKNHNIYFSNLRIYNLSRCGYDLSNIIFRGADLKNITFKNCLLMETDFTGATLENVCFSGSDLSHAIFDDCKIVNCTFSTPYWKMFFGYLETGLLHSRFCSAHIKNSVFTSSDLSNSNFKPRVSENIDPSTTLIQNCNFNNANIYHSEFNECIFENVLFKNASLDSSDFSNAKFKEVEISKSDLSKSIFNETYIDSLYFSDIRKCAGIKVSNCTGNSAFPRIVLHQEYLEDFIKIKNKYLLYRFVFFLWWLTSNYGRSIKRWVIMSFVIAFGFAILYTPFNFNNKTIQEYYDKIAPEFEQDVTSYKEIELSFFDATYFSIVTFTTLGFGDIKASNTAARFFVSIEVILGYIMLGGIISLITNYIIRRL